MTQDRKNNYDDAHRMDKNFSMGEKFFLRVCPQKSPIYYRKGLKLAPCFVRRCEILERIGLVAYHLPLPPSLAYIHDVFNVLALT